MVPFLRSCHILYFPRDSALLVVQYADSTQVVVTSSNAGSVSFVNTAFWGPSNQVAVVCNFIYVDVSY